MRSLPTPSCRGAPLSPVSAMWDNVISWLEYSLRGMRFSYSLTRVIISWQIVSIWRTLVHPTLHLTVSHISCLFVHFFSPTLYFHFPCSFPLRQHSFCLCITASHFPSTLCIPFLLLVISFLISLSCFLSLTQLPHSLSPPSFSPLCPRESHISNERN